MEEQGFLFEKVFLASGTASPFPQAETEAAPLDEMVSMRRAVENFQRHLIRHAVTRNQGNWAAAARQLGMHRSNLHNLAKRLGLHRSYSQP